MGHTSVEQTVVLVIILILISSVISSVCLSFHVLWKCCFYTTMTSSNGNSFRVTGHLCGEFTDHITKVPNRGCCTDDFARYKTIIINQSIIHSFIIEKNTSVGVFYWRAMTPGGVYALRLFSCNQVRRKTRQNALYALCKRILVWYSTLQHVK